MRPPAYPDEFTPFGLWMRERVSDRFCITNIDYWIEDYKNKRIMLLEEKRHSASLRKGQRLSFQVLDNMLMKISPALNYDYWGFYELQLKDDLPGPGMKINSVPITCRQLLDHLHFRRECCKPHPFEHRRLPNGVYIRSLNPTVLGETLLKLMPRPDIETLIDCLKRDAKAQSRSVNCPN